MTKTFLGSPVSQDVEDLRWKKFPVLDDGFVTLVDVMGDDSSIVQAARVSYGKDVREDASAGEAVREDRHLIRYLMRHRHTTPFEMAEVKLLVRVPMDCWRQWIRHRTANVNEYSTRYTTAIDSQQRTPPDEWRLQATNNKQGSGGMLEEWPEGWSGIITNTEFVIENHIRESIWRIKRKSFEWREFWDENGPTPGQFLTWLESRTHKGSKDTYQVRLGLGVAKEQARKDLPLSTYTEAYWKCDLHNILHFLGLRMDSHAQKEIRDYANVIGHEIIKPLFPIVWEAFKDYRLGGMFLTALDQQMFGELVQYYGAAIQDRQGVEEFIRGPHCKAPKDWKKERSRERDEFLDKLETLSLIS